MKLFSRAASWTARAAGRPGSFAGAVTIVLVWALCGPYFHYSDLWQLVINTGTTIVTFLMIFLLQNSQNRDGAAVQAKLDTIIAALDGADDRLRRIEDKTEEEIEEARERN